MLLFLDLSKSKKPYGHTAYSRRTKTGKVVFIQQRGVRPTEVMEAPTPASVGIFQKYRFQRLDWRKNKLQEVLPWEVSFRSVEPGALSEDDLDAYTKIKAKLGGRSATLSDLREAVRVYLAELVEDVVEDDIVDDTMRDLINDWGEHGVIHVEVKKGAVGDLNTLLFKEAAKKFYGVEFTSVSVGAMPSAYAAARSDTSGYRTTYTGEIKLSDMNAVLDVIARLKTDGKATARTPEEKWGLHTLLHEHLHGAGVWKKPGSSWNHYEYGAGRALQEGAVELLSALDNQDFWKAIGISGMEPLIKYSDTSSEHSNSYPMFVNAVERLICLAVDGDLPSIPAIDSPKKNKVLTDLCFGWKPTTRIRKLAELIAAGIDDDPATKKLRTDCLELEIEDALETMSYSGYGDGADLTEVKNTMNVGASFGPESAGYLFLQVKLRSLKKRVARFAENRKNARAIISLLDRSVYEDARQDGALAAQLADRMYFRAGQKATTATKRAMKAWLEDMIKASTQDGWAKTKTEMLGVLTSPFDDKAEIEKNHREWQRENR